ncbi:hypothetical protein VTI28DRAFT_51 [Corynascus sepedonium]
MAAGRPVMHNRQLGESANAGRGHGTSFASARPALAQSAALDRKHCRTSSISVAKTTGETRHGVRLGVQKQIEA